jgi:putative phosphoribosyl transferase
MLYRDRGDAGRQLAARLRHLEGRDAVVLALPRGGVPVAYEIATALRAPLDVFIVRKLGVPGHEELAMGAIASGGVQVLNDDVVDSMRIGRAEIEGVARRERAELARREQAYRPAAPPLDVRGRTAVLVDDGLATGASMKAAVAALRLMEPAAIVVAVPVGAPETCAAIRAEADEVVCGATPDPFWAVGRWYEDFSQTGDDEVRELLARAARA